MNIVDKLTRGTDSATGRPIIATLAAPGKTVGASSITLSGSTNWSTTTPVYIAIYTVTAAGIKDPTSQTDWKATLSGTTLSNMTPTGGVDRTYAAGAYVEITFTSAWAKDLYDALSVSMNPDGSLKTAPVRAALGLTTAASGGWDILNAGSAPTVSSGYNNGNKEFKLTFSGVDLTAVLSAGMRLKFDRSTPAPSQCMSFTAASSQYASKSSPTGISFTAAFTTEAWVYLNSYGGVSGCVIINRRNGSSGAWEFQTNAAGQLSTLYGDAAGNFTLFTSYQSIPLKRWVHVACSVSSVSGKTALVYINGMSVPFSTSSVGAGATTLVQAGNLTIGTEGTGTAGTYFDGYIAEARVWSAAQTATQIADNMAVSLTGSETNLVGLWQGNGAFTDKTTNANTLTAAGGAVPTQVANPYNTTEYAIVTKVVYATSNTTVTVFTGTDYNIPLATLTNPFSSYQKVPFGFPASRGKWRSDAVFRSSIAQNSPVASTWYPFWTYTIPSGEWLYGYSTPAYVVASGNISVAVTLSNTNNAESNPLISTESNINTVSQYVSTYAKQDYLSLASPTIHYLNIRQLTGTVSSIGINTSSYTTLYAECAYL